MAFFGMRESKERKDRKDRKEKGKTGKRRPPARRKSCRLCADPKSRVDYKDARLLQQFITERARIVPRRISGNCAPHQREVTFAIKRARDMALLPFSAIQQR